MAFFLSGVAGIAYELVWVRHVERIVGASTTAIATTVAVFFVGLALGAALGGRLFDRLHRPLWAYAKLELAIGAVAAVVPGVLGTVESLVVDAGAAATLWAYALTSLVLLIPTSLLGATFPAMARAISHLCAPVEGTARFYGFNTLGGMAGCLSTAFLLLPALGLRSTNLAMVGANCCAAAFIAALALSARAASRAATPRAQQGPTSERRAPLGQKHAALLAFFSGVAAIGIEVLWARALALSFPGTVYVFAVVLSAYLAGIAVGSLVMPWIERRVTGDRRLLAVLYAVAGVGVLGSMLAFPRIAGLFYELVGSGTIASWRGYIVAIGLLTWLTMLPATFAMGAALPLLIGAASVADRGDDATRRGRTAGRLYALNIAGGVLGSVGATFLLMPLLRVERALAGCGALYFALAMVAHGRLSPARSAGTPTEQRPSRGRLAAAVLLAVTVGLMAANALPPVAPERHAGRGQVFAEDGPSASITISEVSEVWGVPVRSLKINNFYGLNITSPSTVAMQYRLGHLPLLLHGQPKRALLIGFATGNTLAAMAEHALARLDCVEIHGKLFALAPYFKAVNHAVYQREDVHLYAQDGRHFVRREGPLYDVVVGDLYLPRNPGAGALYSQEHFRAVRRRLTERGLFVAWLPLWQLSPWEVGVIARTFLSVFPRAEAWLGNARRRRPVLGLVGFVTALRHERPRQQRLARRLADAVRRSMRRTYGARGGSPGAEGDARRVLTAPQLRRWARQKPLNTVDDPVIEYSAPRTLTRYQLRNRSPAKDNLRTISSLEPAP